MSNILRNLAFAIMLFPAGALHARPLTGAVVITNEGVPIDHISATALRNIYTGRTKYWEGGDEIVIILLADITDDGLIELSGMDSSEFRTFWQRLVFSGRGEEPKKSVDVPSLIRLVASTRGAIALAPADAPLKGVKVLEVQ